MADKSLQDRVAVITGASGGLGLHFAKVLAGQGAKVALTARRKACLDLTQSAEITAAGGVAHAIALDVADAHAIGPALDAAQEALGPLAIMINNAGISGEGLATEISAEDWDRCFAVNVRVRVLRGARSRQTDADQRPGRGRRGADRQHRFDRPPRCCRAWRPTAPPRRPSPR